METTLARLDGGPETHHAPSPSAIVPSIRSSDLRLLLTDPLDYYFKRRLGLVAPTVYAEALSRGAWLHEEFRRMGLPDEARRSEIEALLAKRRTELSDAAKRAGLSLDATRERIEAEERDCRTAAAWWSAAIDLPFGADRRSLRERLARPGVREVCREVVFATAFEVRVRADAPFRSASHECRVQPDLLLYDESSAELWIVDLKSCGGSPIARLAACPDEFQTQLYTAALARLLERGVMQRRFGLPKEATLGGMIHVAIRKPTIEFGPNDRDFTIDDSPLKAGPRKGQPRNEKRYLGEPRFANYLRRVEAWFRGEGDFVDRAAEWAVDPPVNISTTPVALLREPTRRRHFEARLDLVASFARRAAVPERFAPSEPIRYGQSESPYIPLRSAPVEDWPRLIELHGFEVRHRDDADGEVVRESPCGRSNCVHPFCRRAPSPRAFIRRR